MKVAVITWYKYNYGTVLQAIATQKFLSANGYEVELINYISEKGQTLIDKLTILQRLNRKSNYKCNEWYNKSHQDLFISKDNAFMDAIKSNCKMTEKVVTDDDFKKLAECYDAFVCGSDQIWNPYWLDDKFFLNFVPAGKVKVAYAPSMGISTIPEEKKEELREMLTSFNYLSVREEKVAAAINKLIDKDVVCVCDPVFLLKKNIWKNFASQIKAEDEPYIFYYFLSFQLEHWIAAKKFAKSKGFKLIGIPVVGLQFYFYRGNKRVDASPEMFVKLILNASYVLTDSFHATSFAIIFNKQFYVFQRFPMNRYSQNSRVENLLSYTGLTNRLMKYRSLQIVQQKDINYLKVRANIAKWIESSREYLLKALSSQEM